MENNNTSDYMDENKIDNDIDKFNLLIQIGGNIIENEISYNHQQNQIEMEELINNLENVKAQYENTCFLFLNETISEREKEIYKLLTDILNEKILQIHEKCNYFNEKRKSCTLFKEDYERVNIT